MEQVLSIYLPMWDVELLRRPAQLRTGNPARLNARPLLLTAFAARQEIVARCCARARQAGAVPGMNLAEARALCPQAQVAPLDAGKSRQAMEKLALWCQRFSPTVMIDPDARGGGEEGGGDGPDGLLLDVTGTAHLFGGEHLLLTQLATRLGRMGFAARLALAPTIGAAWALARYDTHALAIVNHERLAAALGPLPIEALRVPGELCQTLRQVGIECIRHLLAQPREKLKVRFGPALLLRMDQALGHVRELMRPFHAVEVPAVGRAFDGATTQLEAIFLTVEELLTELCALLLKKECGARGLRLELQRLDLPPLTQEWVLGRPNRDARHLWKLLRPKVEKAHLGFGVEGIWLTAYWTAPIKHQQIGAWQTGVDAHDDAYEAFLDTLINRWGERRVLAARPVASHVPEIARQFCPVRQVTAPENAALLLPLDRPSVLLEHPEPAQAVALQPDHPPALLMWRGREYPLAPEEETGAGAERIVTTWWGTKAPSTRDYFKVQTQAGLWLWVFREQETARWFVHGLWA